MKSLQRVFDDLKRGENIDLYATVVVALTIAVLNLLGVASQSWVNPLGLAVLALLASAILGNRHRLDEIREKIGQIESAAIMKDWPPELDHDVERASEIWLFGVHAIAPLRHQRTVLESKLAKGKTIRVLVVNPNGAACAMSAARSPGKPSVERERANIVANLNDLCELKKIAPSKLEIRTIDDPLFYAGYMLDPEDSDGVIYLRRYTYQAGITPKFVYRPKNREWYELIRSEIYSLWNRGTMWSCEERAESS